MKKENSRILIINRSFWPSYPVLGEALLRLAERISIKAESVSVICQDNQNIRKKLREQKRGKRVSFYPQKGFTNSSSNIALRLFESILFLFYVFLILLWVRPTKIYVSTDPPIIIPFIVMIYSFLFKANYVYHLQDIHPEATNVVIPINKFIYKIFFYMDVISMRRAKYLITITKNMKRVILNRSKTKVPIYILNNPSIPFKGVNASLNKTLGFSFCGNAGRLQLIPLVLDSIENYFRNGGKLEFVFAGEGIYSRQIEEFSKKFDTFHYLGFIKPNIAAQIISKYSWALLPIKDEVTSYSFPSKSSTYLYCDTNILAICGKKTSVAKWVDKNSLGLVVKPEINAITEIFFKIESGNDFNYKNEGQRRVLKKNLDLDIFVKKIEKIMLIN